MIEIIAIGGYATIQGCGRKGVQKYGIPKGGYMDRRSAVLANKMLDNDLCSPLVELFGGHLSFHCHADMLLSLAGAFTTVSTGYDSIQSPAVFCAKKGDQVKIGTFSKGNIIYIAVKDGFNVDKSFGTASTYVPASLGPNAGTNLRIGDKIEAFDCEVSEKEKSDAFFDRHLPKNQSISVYKGPEFNLLTKNCKKTLFEESFEIGQVSRMGYRLFGTTIKTNGMAALTSRYVSRGTIQLPYGGNPIVLMSDSQTTGGYPRIAQVVARDIDAIAQMRTGSRVRFRLQ